MVLIAVFVGTILLVVTTIPAVKKDTTKDRKQTASEIEDKPTQKVIVGKTISVGEVFKVTVPGGWRASVSSNKTFLAVQFARPSQLESLVYDPDAQAIVDYGGIPAWNGLTEHFYIRAITDASQAFNLEKHEEVTSESFLFNDGTTGTKYSVTKHAAEAQKWGGLQKDSEWFGRVYVYKKDDILVEAHLAYYPSTKIDTSFFEKVAQTIAK